jgi:hypothetical protein
MPCAQCFARCRKVLLPRDLRHPIDLSDYQISGHSAKNITLFTFTVEFAPRMALLTIRKFVPERYRPVMTRSAAHAIA